MSFALGLHTTTADLDIAIAKVDQLNYPHINHLKHKSLHLGRELSTQVHICLSDFMDEVGWSDLNFIAIAKGVGSFTGTRIGIVLARTLGEQLDIPVYAIDCETITQYTDQAKTLLSPSQILLEIAGQQWQKEIYSHWSEALPIYTSN